MQESATAVFVIAILKFDVTGAAVIAVTPITWLIITIIINKFIAIIMSYFQVVSSSIIMLKSIIMEKLSDFLKIIIGFDRFLAAVVARSLLADFGFDRNRSRRCFVTARRVVLERNHHPWSCWRQNLHDLWYVPSFELLFRVHC